ncbi:MAG: hypothetical protein Q8J65_09500 [Nitrosomonadales bacterium]|nr:hypothetical protein [Nitrosomonadales bacterium]
MQILTSLVAGMLFGLGLLLSGMANPQKILDFLDITGQWDPSLLMVMLGALAVSFWAFRYASCRNKTWLGSTFTLPDTKQVDRRLILGSLVFGAGWGIAGYCPGPALTSLFTGIMAPLIFVVAMITGMVIYELLERRR